MPSGWMKGLLFLSSYSPLFLIFALRLAPLAVSIVLWTVAVLSLVGLYTYIALAKRFATMPLTIAESAPSDGEVMSYVVTYLVPFLGIDFTDKTDIASLVIIMGVLFLVYINSNMLFVNPALSAIGFHFFTVKTEGQATALLLTRRLFLPRNGALSVARLGNYIYVEVGNGKAKR